MAEFKSDTATAQESKTSGGWPSNLKAGSEVRFSNAEFLIDGWSAGDTLILDSLYPEGAQLVPELCHVVCENPGTTLTLDVGDADDADRYCDGLAVSAGGTFQFSGGVASLTPYATTSMTPLIATVATASALTDGQKVVFKIAYQTAV